MVALATVAGTIICGGAIVVACCWQNRERGHLKKGGKYQSVSEFPPLPSLPRAPGFDCVRVAICPGLNPDLRHSLHSLRHRLGRNIRSLAGEPIRERTRAFEHAM